MFQLTPPMKSVGTLLTFIFKIQSIKLNNLQYLLMIWSIIDICLAIFLLGQKFSNVKVIIWGEIVSIYS